MTPSPPAIHETAGSFAPPTAAPGLTVAAGRWRGVGVEPPDSYWALTRRPLPSLVFILPMLLLYELGVGWPGAPGGASRTGTDAWLRQALAAAGLTDRWLPPLALVIGLLVWHGLQGRPWRFPPACLVGMALESLGLALALIGLGRLLDLGFVRLEEGQIPLAAGQEGGGGLELGAVLGFLGAGVYEEALFRLVLIPLLLKAFRLVQAPEVLAGTLAVTGSSLLFSIAHHAGAPGESFTWFAFVFRWLAGVCFAWIFLARGFGIAVGTHAAYDVLVGALEWHF